MVVTREDNVPTNEWHLCRVLNLHSGRDSHVRVVDSEKNSCGIITRPIVKLVILSTC